MAKIGFTTIMVLVLGVLCAGCKPEVGSAKWCEQQGEKDKGDWTVKDASAFAQHCVFRGTEKQ